MVIRDALIAELDEVDVNDGTIEKTLLDRTDDPGAEYEGTDEQKQLIDLCVIDCLYRVYTRANVTEGGYTLNQASKDKIEARLLYLATKYQVIDVLSVLVKQAATITDISNYW